MPKITTKNKEYAKLLKEVKKHAVEIGVYDEIKYYVQRLTRKEIERALINAIHIMENSLTCNECPQKNSCDTGIAECEYNILQELLNREVLEELYAKNSEN